MFHLVDIFLTLKSPCLLEVLSSDEIREQIKMTCVGEADIKAAFSCILAIVSDEERLRRLKVNNRLFFISYIFSNLYITFALICRQSD